MKKTWKDSIPAIILLIILALTVDFLYMRGSEIKGVKEINEPCQVTIYTYQHMQHGDGSTHTLNGEQIKRLKKFLLRSKFRREFDKLVSYRNTDMHNIYVYSDTGELLLCLSSLGGEYLKWDGQVLGAFLKIQNPDWSSGLDAILTSTK